MTTFKWTLEHLRTLEAALEAPTHEANDYNCQDWPPGSGCEACAGDAVREAALRLVKDAIIEPQNRADFVEGVTRHMR